MMKFMKNRRLIHGILSIALLFIASACTRPVKEVINTPVEDNRIELDDFSIVLSEDYKIEKGEMVVETIGSQFSVSDGVNDFTWIIIPKSFNKGEVGLDTVSDISFATIYSRKSKVEDYRNGIANLAEILDMSEGTYPDNLYVSYSVEGPELIGKNISGDDVFGYSYIVFEGENGEPESKPVREFTGAFWTYGEMIYILQDQTQISAWGQNKIERNSVIRTQINDIALSINNKKNE